MTFWIIVALMLGFIRAAWKAFKARELALQIERMSVAALLAFAAALDAKHSGLSGDALEYAWGILVFLTLAGLIYSARIAWRIHWDNEPATPRRR